MLPHRVSSPKSCISGNVYGRITWPVEFLGIRLMLKLKLKVKLNLNLKLILKLKLKFTL
jgi:hypothetical protein